ncbi:ATP-binding protein [bacterium]|nr:ATP-binding protein [bacterium]
MTRHAVALQKTLIDMRELAFTETPIVKRSQRPLRLETLVWAVVNEWRQVARASGLTLHVMVQEQGLYILGDEKRLRWAIGNLIDNAIKYTLVGGVLSLEIRGTADDKAQLRVRDNGVGILKEDLPRVFTRFYRGTPLSPGGSVLHIPGMGQGLYVSRQIIEAHGGSIEVRSKPGKGTAVMFTLPLTSPQTLDLPLFAAEADMDGETVQLPQYAMFDEDELP